MHDQCPPLMSTRCAIQSFSNTPSPVPTVLNTGTKPQWKRYGGQHLDTHKWIFLYKETERERERVYFVKETAHSRAGEDLSDVSA